MRVLIIRHGDPDYARDTLTERGWAEAEALSERLARENITAVYTSPLGRAKDTASKTLEKIGMTAEILPWLCEFPLPIFPDYAPQGLCAWDMSVADWARYPELQNAQLWKRNALYQKSGIPERVEQLAGQFDALMEKHGYVRQGIGYRLASRCEDHQTIALFCHMGLGNVLLAHITGSAPSQWWHKMVLPTSSVSVAYIQKYESDFGILRLCGVGDVSHLYCLHDKQ